MARFALPPSGPAAPETIEDHLKVGRRWLAQAMQDHPGLLPEEALILAQQVGGPLDASSVSRYRADLRYTLEAELNAAGRAADFTVAWEKLDAAVSERKAMIPEDERRTSALKVEDATEKEAAALFAELQRHGLEHKNPNTVLAALFVLVAGHAGFRPVELRGATFDDPWLTLPNAKKRPGHPLKRRLDLSDVHKDVRLGITLLIGLIDHDLSKREFAKWQKCLAGQLQRACERIGIRTLSLYSFRHIAIASWSAAGLSPREIALLCGHISIRTAHAHYARAKVGHKRSAVARADHSQDLCEHPAQEVEESAKPPEPQQTTVPEGLTTELVFDDMPPPVFNTTYTPPALPSEEVQSHFARNVDPRSKEEIGASLREARKRAEKDPISKWGPRRGK